MPELPEVETARMGLLPVMEGYRFTMWRRGGAIFACRFPTTSPGG